MMKLNYLMDQILYQIFKIILSISSKKHEALTDNSISLVTVKRIENRIGFKVNTGYYLEILTPESIKLYISTETKITKDKNTEITEVVHCNVLDNNYQQDSRVLYTFVRNKSFGQILEISPNKFIF